MKTETQAEESQSLILARARAAFDAGKVEVSTEDATGFKLRLPGAFIREQKRARAFNAVRDSQTIAR
jgi:hypothetical protein